VKLTPSLSDNIIHFDTASICLGHAAAVSTMSMKLEIYIIKQVISLSISKQLSALLIITLIDQKYPLVIAT
jgi:hypothetical protein